MISSVRLAAIDRQIGHQITTFANRGERRRLCCLEPHYHRLSKESAPTGKLNLAHIEHEMPSSLDKSMFVSEGQPCHYTLYCHCHCCCWWCSFEGGSAHTENTLCTMYMLQIEQRAVRTSISIPIRSESGIYFIQERTPTIIWKGR